MDSLIAASKFRRDLYSRLSSVIIQVPSLKGRDVGEIERLAKLFYRRFREEYKDQRGFKDVRVKNPLWAELAKYPYSWPGNVRELMHVVNTTLLEVGGKNIRLEDFVKRIHAESFYDESLVYQKSRRILSVREDTVLEQISKQGHVTRKEVKGILKCGSTVAWSILKQMCDRRLIGKERFGKSTIYTLFEENIKTDNP